ncbi:MAG: hypothetical protein IIA85_01035 [Nanoarchaeota archaeon]|nr:hypothetical protein [Nanoarchaeota archaeon]
MKQKTSLKKTGILTIGILLILSLTALISAERIIDNATEIDIDNFVAGSTAQANFSYSYLRDRPENPDNSPLILRINITSSNETNFPVWRGDFGVSGFIKRYILFGLILVDERDFTCSENEFQTIIHPLGSEPVSAENGTFYCYDPEGNLDFGDFNSYDEVFLNIKSHPALWPGQYNLEAKLFYLNDTYPPIVSIINKNTFETNYYRESNNIEVHVEIDDINLEDYWGTIFTLTQNITVPFSHKIGGIYYFTKILPIEIQEGNYELKIFAKDTEGNIGSDNTTLRIDRTGPNVELVEPVGGIFSEIIPIKFNVTDEKAGVDNESVQVRLREIKEGIGLCPETGGPINGTGCITTPWINLTLNSTSNLFEVDINTTNLNLTSGSYWLEAKAEDILGNKAEWIA